MSSAARRFLSVFIGLQLLILAGFRLLMGRFATVGPGTWLVWYGLTALVVSLVMIIQWLRRGHRRDATITRLARQIGDGNFRAIDRLPWSPGTGNEPVRAVRQMSQDLEARQQKLQEHLAQMNAVLGSMIEGVIGTDTDGRILMANEAATEMLGRPLDELVGHRILDTVRFTELRSAIEIARRTRAPQTIELETTTAPRRRILASVNALTDPVSAGLAIVLHDVTELRKMETMRRDFVANVSHELKTPLASIRASAETLRLGALYDNQSNAGFVEQIETQAKRLEQQVQGLLELSEIQAGELPLDFATVNVNQVCRNIVGQFEAEASRNSVELFLELADEPLILNTDEDSVQTIVRNLTSNALRYTRPGGRVTVRTRQLPRQVMIEVADTGIGIPGEQRERVFERFYRVDDARSRERGGSGLGLAIVKHLAEALGGQVQLESRVGKGSQFRVLLPVRD